MEPFETLLATAQRIPIATVVQISAEEFTYEERRSRTAMNTKMAQLTIHQLEQIIQKHRQHRNSTFADGSNIYMELQKYCLDDLRAACRRASQPPALRKYKDGLISDVAAMPSHIQSIIRMSIGEEKRKREAEQGSRKRKREADQKESRKTRWESSIQSISAKRQRLDTEEGIDFAKFMAPVEDHILKERIGKFIARTDNEALRMAICGVCARERPSSEVAAVSLPDIPNSDLLKPPEPHRHHDLTHGLLLHKPRSAMGTPLPIASARAEVKVSCCKDCLRDLKKGQIPPFSLANNMWIGDVPHELRVLSLAESVLVARYFPAAHIVKLFPKVKGSKYWNNDSLNSAVKGNVSTYWLDPNSIADMLNGQTMPPSPNILAATIGVTIIGPQNLPEKTLPGFLRVRRDRVRKALLWLKDNNPIYRDIIISEDVLDMLPEDAIPRQILETTRYSSDTDALEQERSGYVVSDDDDSNGHDDMHYIRGIPMVREGKKSGTLIQKRVADSVEPIRWQLRDNWW